MIYLDYVWLSTKVVSNLFKFIGRKRISYEVFEEIEEKNHDSVIKYRRGRGIEYMMIFNNY